MPEESKNGMQCAEFDGLLAEALDGTLSGEKLAGFQAHANTCGLCGPLLAEAKAGQHWLKALGEVEPPEHLVHNILVATSGVETISISASVEVPHTLLGRAREWAGVLFGPVVAMARQPRFAMSFGMAFFSLSIALSVAGVKLSDLRRIDLRPSALQRTYYETSGRVVKYYENIRFVYEIESRVREFKRATTPAEPGPEQKEPSRKNNNNTSGQPDPKQERNYSQSASQPVLASAPDSLPVVVTTYRRLA